MNKVADTMTLKMILIARLDKEAPNGYTLKLYPSDQEWAIREDDINMGLIPVYFSTPPAFTKDELVVKAIETLKAKQQRTRAEAEKECTRLQKEINKLFLITHQPQDDSIIGEQ